MGKLNISKGEWYKKEVKCEYGNYSICDIASTHSTFIPARSIGENDSNSEDNAILICDAGNTYQKCEILPSDLLIQRNELLQALIEAKEALEWYMENTKPMDNDWQTFHDLGMNSRMNSEEIINKSTK